MLLFCWLPNKFPGLVNVSKFVTDLYQSQTFAEAKCIVILWWDDHLAGLVDETKFAADLNGSQPFREFNDVEVSVILWRDDHVAGLVDAAPFAADLYVSQAFGENTGTFELWRAVPVSLRRNGLDRWARNGCGRIIQS
jgi:hypothetical protein